MEIKVLREKDVDIFFPFRLRALMEEPESFGGSYEEWKSLTTEEVAPRLEYSDDSFVFGAFMPDLVGTIGFFRRKGIKQRHKGTIWGMYTAREVRGQGVGRALMEKAIEEATMLSGLEELLLSVVTTNRAALALYKSMGFEEYALERKALKVDDSYLDEIYMVLKLKF